MAHFIVSEHVRCPALSGYFFSKAILQNSSFRGIVIFSSNRLPKSSIQTREGLAAKSVAVPRVAQKHCNILESKTFYSLPCFYFC